MANPSGRKVPILFGAKKVKKNGKSVQVQLVSRVHESTIKALDIKLKQVADDKSATQAKLVKDKKGRFYLPRTGGTASGRRTLQCSIDGVEFFTEIVPTNCSYGQAKVALKNNSKAVVFKTPSGGKQVLGKVKAAPKKAAPKPKAKAK